MMRGKTNDFWRLLSTYKLPLTIIFMISIASFMSSCTEKSKDRLKTKVVETIAAGGASFVSSSLDCSERVVIQDDFEEKLFKLKIFERKSELEKLNRSIEQKSEKRFLDTVCSSAMKSVLPVLIGEGLNKIPKEWGCKATTISIGLDEAAQELCSKL
jgi:hypothetical protein